MGRGIYAENAVVALIVLSIFISGISLLMVSQYRRPEKSGAGGFSPLWAIPSPRRIGRNAACSCFAVA